MEGDQKQKSSSNLVGAKCSSAESESSLSSGVFSALFPHPSKEPFHFLEAEKKKNECASRDTKTESSGNKRINGGGIGNQNTSDGKISYVRDEKAEPFHYSSSIYYGGRDHVLTQTTTPSGHNSGATKFNKDRGDNDDSNSASRGNWWQGSLYY